MIYMVQAERLLLNLACEIYVQFLGISKSILTNMRWEILPLNKENQLHRTETHSPIRILLSYKFKRPIV